MASRNLRRSWARNLALALVLTLGIGGDILLGMFFTGLENKAAQLVPAAFQSVPLQVLAPADVQMESWLSWATYSGSFAASRNFDQSYRLFWSDCYSEMGRGIILAVDFETPFFRTFPLEGRWPFEVDEVALPEPMAASLGVRTGGTVTLAVGDPAHVENYRVTGVFRPEVPFRAAPGTRLPTSARVDQTADWPLLSLRVPGGAVPLPGSSALPEYRFRPNGAWIQVAEDRAASLEQRMLGYHVREHPSQPAAVRFGTVLPSFDRARMGPELGRVLGARIFATGRKALGASFLFVGIGVFVILLIAFIERRRELAVLKTVGMNNNMVLTMVLMELGAVAGFAMAAGSALALTVGTQISRVVDYVPPPTFTAWLWAFGHTSAILVLATVLPLSMMQLATVQQLLQNQRLYLVKRKVTLS
jgi:hypothetical protein